MTLIDRLIPVYFWFCDGLGELQRIAGVISLILMIGTFLTVKGFYIPTVYLGILFCAFIVWCTIQGYITIKYGIRDRFTSYSNQNANPEIAEMHREILAMKRMLEKRG